MTDRAKLTISLINNPTTDIYFNLVTALMRAAFSYLPMRICLIIAEEAMNCYEQTACCSGSESNVSLSPAKVLLLGILLTVLIILL